MLAGESKMGHPVRLSLLHRPASQPVHRGHAGVVRPGRAGPDRPVLPRRRADRRSRRNINLLGTGEWPGQGTARFPGSFGSAFMYMMVPRTILFREEHSPRVLVRRVDMISAPGRVGARRVFRRGTAQALVTGRCVFTLRSGTAALRAGVGASGAHRGGSAGRTPDSTSMAWRRRSRPTRPSTSSRCSAGRCGRRWKRPTRRFAARVWPEGDVPDACPGNPTIRGGFRSREQRDDMP